MQVIYNNNLCINLKGYDDMVFKFDRICVHRTCINLILIENPNISYFIFIFNNIQKYNLTKARITSVAFISKCK